ncbi:Phage transcriptional regulator, AlpA (modular protein) [Agrobacterium fabrum str. J-07]|uniref:helix-turn-helix transcriptional regulator n=1 Tax=Agrobacterium fabrum TaxID=1176649 RepID=UPI0009BB6201|nr:AlpA family phage regulatory protein [Agrobacterium fabrum]CUX26459.1 Phage transcriptional regulator, AlpA (modular protein) [Agrobacterium fabrum str. J-07]
MKHIRFQEEKLHEGIVIHAFPQTGFVRLNQIVGPNGPLPISKSGFWAGVKNGKFPQPHKISPRVTVWKAEDIHDLLREIERGGK